MIYLSMYSPILVEKNNSTYSIKVLAFLEKMFIVCVVHNIFIIYHTLKMLRFILGLLALWAIKIIFNVWWAIVTFLSEIIKIWLVILFFWAIMSAFDWNFLPILLVIWLPIAWIIYVINKVRNNTRTEKRINKKQKVKLDDSDFVEVIDST